MSLERLFCPRGVVVVGSVAEGKLGYQLVRQILNGGFGAVFAVNPKGQGVFSVPGYRRVGEIEAPVDLAVIASPASSVPQVVEECGQAGVGVAVVITAGFSEVGNRAGEEEVQRVARRHGVRVVGPNCAGVMNTHYGLFASLETRPPAGWVALVSQSGAVGGAVLSWAEEQGLGFSKFVSYGNRADVDEVDLLRYLATDPETQVVALYVESVGDGRAFMRAVEEFSAHKPLVVIKAGRTVSGQRAAWSHTGALAGTDAVYEAALGQSGALRVHTVEELFDLCKGLVCAPPVRGRRVAIVTNSGGPGVMAADRAEELGLEVAEPGTALRRRLAGLLPSYGSLRNPFDLTVEGTGEGYRETLAAVLEEYDAAVAVNVAPAYLDSVPLARGVWEAAEGAGKTVVAAFMAGRVVAEAVSYLRERGVATYPSPERAVEVLARMAWYQEWREKVAAGRCGADEQSWEPQPLPGEGPLLEPEAMAWLRENGLPVLEFREAGDAQQAVAACREIGYPVVMKVVSPDIVHKSEWGGVVVGIDDDDAARAAFERIRTAAAGKDFRGVVVYPQIEGAQEVLVGVSRDSQFGPVVVFGLGGIYTEVLRDFSLRVAPVRREEAEGMIRQVRGYAVLSGARGRAAGAVERLAELVVKVSHLPFRYPQVAELDLNPVFVRSDGVWVGDVRVLRKEPV